MSAIIKTVNLRKVYRVGNEKIVALESVNLEIAKGQVCCILGTSGSGKSTLLNQLAGLEKPTRGDVFIKNKNVSKMSEKQLAKFRQKNIGFVFQSYNLLAGMTAVENVALPLTFRGVSKKKRLLMAKKMLITVGLGKRLKHAPSEMSGGQQQRVGIARAFVSNPKVVFADEPTGNLDTRTTREVMDMFMTFAREQEITIILVTHDPNLARYADRIVTIVDGLVVGDKNNRSLYDITNNLTEIIVERGKINDKKGMWEIMKEHAHVHGDGVSVHAMEKYLKTVENPEAWIEEMKTLLDDNEEDLALFMKLGRDSGHIPKELGIQVDSTLNGQKAQVTPVLPTEEKPKEIIEVNSQPMSPSVEETDTVSIETSKTDVNEEKSNKKEEGATSEI